VFSGGFDGRLERAHVSAKTRALANGEKALFVAGTVPRNVPTPDRPAVTEAVHEGFLAGFRAVQYASAAVSFLAALIAFFALPARPHEAAAERRSPPVPMATSKAT
jgi:RecB family exonuclease